jgi:intracellular septation protein
MMDQAISLPDRVWLNLSYMWIVFFIFSGIANIYVAYQYDTDTWVNFKLFGLMGLTLVFIIVQGIYISRYIKETGKQFDETEQRVMDASIETLADAELDSVSPAKSRNKPSDDNQ